MSTWNGAAPPPDPPIGPAGWLRVGLRGAPLGLLTFGGLGLLLLLRLAERPLFGLRRPVTPRITRFVCRMAFVILGMRHSVRGRPMAGHGALVANHASWLDIFALNACDLVYFVSKAEVRGWPGIGWLARATGTLFINRDGREAAAQKALFEARLDAGHRLLFFPEGTSTDGLRVLPFKTTLFAAFLTPHLRETCAIQPVTVIYTAPEGAHPAFYGWWGEMDFAGHLLRVLAQRRQGSVEVVFHEPLPVAAFADRKALARAAEDRVRAALARRQG
ncbi:MAG: 1-acyl-sn-glycerol-3-phosphate acyltransferase [Rhodobacteraceae bacterium]|nr:1-acyl-sn-glycerol-3-phosphate acyltransferase [Paracoccaceae bacterium]